MGSKLNQDNVTLKPCNLDSKRWQIAIQIKIKRMQIQ